MFEPKRIAKSSERISPNWLTKMANEVQHECKEIHNGEGKNPNFKYIYIVKVPTMLDKQKGDLGSHGLKIKETEKYEFLKGFLILLMCYRGERTGQLLCLTHSTLSLPSIIFNKHMTISPSS